MFGLDAAVLENNPEKQAEIRAIEEKLIAMGFAVSQRFVLKEPYIFIDHEHQKWALVPDGEAEPVIYAFADALHCAMWESSPKTCDALVVNLVINRADNPLVRIQLIRVPTGTSSGIYKSRVLYAHELEAAVVYMIHQASRAVSTIDDIAGKLRQLAELKAEGILTEQEFLNKKAELLARM